MGIFIKLTIHELPEFGHNSLRPLIGPARLRIVYHPWTLGPLMLRRSRRAYHYGDKWYAWLSSRGALMLYR
jgi:hypothetical protein